MRRDRTLEKIAKAFADAVADRDFDAAEGWFSTARLHLGRPVGKAGRRAAQAPTRRTPIDRAG